MTAVEPNYPARTGAYASLIEGLLDICEGVQNRDLLNEAEQRLHFFIRERFNAIEAGQLELVDITNMGRNNDSK